MFFSSLKSCVISGEEYFRVCEVRKVFDFKNLR